MQLIQVAIVGLLYIRMPWSNAAPQVTLELDSPAYFSKGDLVLTCRVNMNVTVNSVTFKRDQVTQIGIYDPASNPCTPRKFLPSDLHNYSASCEGQMSFKLTKIKINKTDENEKVWQCTMVSNPGGPCISTTPCISQNINVSLDTPTTSTPKPASPITINTTISPTYLTDSGGGDGLTEKYKIGIGVGCGCGGLIISGILVFYIYRRRNKQHIKKSDDSYNMKPPFSTTSNTQDHQNSHLKDH